jgi:DNA-binding transcriptional ArsR family regulator
MPESMRRFKAALFQALAHPTRIAIIERLQQGELSVSQLCERVEIEQANASQHLAILRNKQIVETRKAGNQIFYRLRDPVFGKILTALREYFLTQATDTLKSLRTEQLEAEKLLERQTSPTRRARRRVKR